MFVVPGTAAICFPAMDSKFVMPVPVFTRTPVLSAKTRLEKSTIFMRDDKGTEVIPHPRRRAIPIIHCGITAAYLRIFLVLATEDAA